MFLLRTVQSFVTVATVTSILIYSFPSVCLIYSDLRSKIKLTCGQTWSSSKCYHSSRRRSISFTLQLQYISMNAIRNALMFDQWAQKRWQASQCGYKAAVAAMKSCSRDVTCPSSCLKSSHSLLSYATFPLGIAAAVPASLDVLSLPKGNSRSVGGYN